MRNNRFIIAAVAAAVAACAWAEAPVISRVADSNYDKCSLEGLSNNGLWAVGYGKSLLNDYGYSFPRLYDVKNNRTTYLFTPQEATTVGEMMATDITDDGTLIVGQYDGKPAIWRTAKGKWETLPVKDSNFTQGRVVKVTSDGKYAIGTLMKYDGIYASIAIWDLSDPIPADITPLNLPKPISLCGELQEYQQLYAGDLSDDGKMFTGLVCYSYAGESWPFIYDMESMTWKGIGYDVTENGEKYEFTKTGEGYNELTSGMFQPGGSKVYGGASTTEDREIIYTYDIATGQVSFIEDSVDFYFGSVDKNGTVYASKTISGPMRNWYVRVGNYWYDWRIMCKQLWNIDWQNDIVKDEYGYSGTLMLSTPDGLTLIASDYSNTPYDSYVMQLPQNLAELAPQVNLLGNYAVTPVDNSAFAILKEVKVTFDRNVEVTGAYNSVQLLDETGNPVAYSINVAVDPGNADAVVASFRNRRLETGKKYTVVFPAGTVGIAGDPERSNAEIRVNYTGRPSAPVAPVTISPENGTQLSKINASSNPVTVVFDAQISAVDSETAGMFLYRLDEENSREQICQLAGSIDGNALSVYPIMEQRLAKGSNYQVVIAAGTVTDISGADPNEEIVINYEGSYVPKASDGAVIFTDDFNQGITAENWMLYDGANLEPTEEMKAWGFEQGLPWWIVREDEMSTDMSAASHSLYTPAGKSDSWMVTNRLYINDDTAVLTFKSQSYRNSAQDRLKVYAYATEDIYTALTPNIVDNIRYYGDLIYDEQQTPGESEELLSGDWRENVIKLEAYAGKNIYLAFVNDNRNQSAVFMDDVEVRRNVRFSVVNLTPETVVAKENVEVKGILTAESLTDTFNGYCIRLLDSENNELCRIEDPEAVCEKGYTVNFTMPQRLVTPVGKETRYVLDVTMGEFNERMECSVKNLAVNTTKRVVIEEYTGQGCPNCPLGHAAMEWIEQDFGEQVLPLTIHTYPNDSFATPQAAKLQEALGMNAAPTARINRGPIVNPMSISDKGDYQYKNAGVWYDYVVAELSKFALADVDIISAEYANDTYTAEVEVKYALDMQNQNVNLLTVICEDNLAGVQSNNRCEVEHPALREWGKGGRYGYDPVQYTYNDVVRTWAGTTYNGTGGYIPATVEGGKAYSATLSVPNIRRISKPSNCTVTVMLIDAESGLVLNANRRSVFDTGIETIEAESDGPAVYYDLQGRRVQQPAHGIYIKRQGAKTEKVIF